MRQGGMQSTVQGQVLLGQLPVQGYRPAAPGQTDQGGGCCLHQPALGAGDERHDGEKEK